MRTTSLFVLSALLITSVAGCTVSDVDAPPFSSPSSLARTIIMSVNRDTLLQDGVDQAEIRLTAQVQPGQSENVRLRAQVFVDGVAQDYGTLSNKNPVTPTTITYRAPAASTNIAGQVPTTVTIAVTPDDSGDFRGEVARQVDIRLIPPGVILPTNPNLAANFTVSPASPKVLDTVTFDASTTTNNGASCGIACTYSWNFGDSTTGSGQVVTHQFRAVGTYQVTLTATDARGASAQRTISVAVVPGTPPTAAFTVSPQNPGINQDVFFNASQSTPAAGRTITSYEWSFGDGQTGSGMLAAHKYSGAGTYIVQLTTTDDAGSVGRSSPLSLRVGPTTAASGEPVANLTLIKTSLTVSANASASTPGSGASITEYSFNWGDGSPLEVVTNPLQTHVYAAAGQFVVTVTVRDSLGRTASAQQTVTLP